MNAQEKEMILVEVAYATEKKQVIKKVNLPSGSLISEAIEKSKIKEQFSEIDLQKQKVGIFSKAASLDTVLKNRDRVEIYRPLIVDPKQVRRARLAKKNKISE